MKINLCGFIIKLIYVNKRGITEYYKKQEISENKKLPTPQEF